MLLARQQTSENEQTKAYVRTTVIGMGGASRNHRYKKFSRATVFVASVTIDTIDYVNGIGNEITCANGHNTFSVLHS